MGNAQIFHLLEVYRNLPNLHSFPQVLTHVWVLCQFQGLLGSGKLRVTSHTSQAPTLFEFVTFMNVDFWEVFSQSKDKFTCQKGSKPIGIGPRGLFLFKNQGNWLNNPFLKPTKESIRIFILTKGSNPSQTHITWPTIGFYSNMINQSIIKPQTLPSQMGLHLKLPKDVSDTILIFIQPPICIFDSFNVNPTLTHLISCTT